MKLSVIMPCFNVEKTLARALDSIFMQRVDFDYEVIIVNDASTDSTLSVAEQYRVQHREIKVIDNPINCGNARSFYNGLSAAQGDYFCVLDGDDYYTVSDKLSRQVDFLDHDEKQEYVATATRYIIDLGENMVYIPPRRNIKEYSYADFLTQNAEYYHTSTYMYRNIFRGNVPDFFKEKLYRGDTPRTTFHLMYSNRKIRVLDFVGSAYTFEFNGIWSSLKEREQFLYQIHYLFCHKENVRSDFEKESIDDLIAFSKRKYSSASDSVCRYPPVAIDDSLRIIKKYVKKFAFQQREFVFDRLFASEYIDSLVATLGYVKRIRNDYPRQAVDTDAVCIVNGHLIPTGGGIWSEIMGLADIYQDKRVYLFVTDMDEIPEDTRTLLSMHENIRLVFPDPECEDKLDYFIRSFAQISPYRAYYFCSHTDVYGMAMMKSDVGCENISLFSFDHGFICGIYNSNIDTIVAKRPVDYHMLRRYFGDKVIYIPAWEDFPKDCGDHVYKPFAQHDSLITASAAARFYKFDTQSSNSYFNLLLRLLKRTGGNHYHYGPIPEDRLQEIWDKLESHGISREHFVQIPWAENLPRDLLEKHVDVFIEPFPVVSYKISLSVMSVGIPLICQDGNKRMAVADFVPPEMPRWRDASDFISILCHLDEESLTNLSLLEKESFEKDFSRQAVSKAIRANQSYPIPAKIACTDDALQDITGSLRLFGNSFTVNICSQ